MSEKCVFCDPSLVPRFRAPFLGPPIMRTIKGGGPDSGREIVTDSGKTKTNFQAKIVRPVAPGKLKTCQPFVHQKYSG